MRPDVGTHLVDFLVLQHVTYSVDDVSGRTGHEGQVGGDTQLGVKLVILKRPDQLRFLKVKLVYYDQNTFCNFVTQGYVQTCDIHT